MDPAIASKIQFRWDSEPAVLEVQTQAEGDVSGFLRSTDGLWSAPVVDGVIAMIGAAHESSSEAQKFGNFARSLGLHDRGVGWSPEMRSKSARLAFQPEFTWLFCKIRALLTAEPTGATIVVAGEDSGFAAGYAAGQFPDRSVVALIASSDPAVVDRCRYWLAASDAPQNLGVIVATPEQIGHLELDGDRIDLAVTSNSAVSGPDDIADLTTAYALLNPNAEIDLDRAHADKHALSDKETRALYWASRAASLAETAVSMHMDEGDLFELMRSLEDRGLIRILKLPAAMARMHVYARTGEALIPRCEQTLGALAKIAFDRFADNAFAHLAGEAASITYGEAAEIVMRTKAALKRDGVNKGDRICVHAIPHLEVNILLLACAQIGAIFVPIGSIWSRETCAGILERLQPRLFFVNDELLEKVPAVWRRKAICLDPQGEVPGDSERYYSSWLDSAGKDTIATFEPCAPDDIAVIMFTSGTTGVPKGAQLSNAAVVRSAAVAAQFMRMGPDDVLLTLNESNSPSGLRAPLQTMLCGASFVIPDNRRNSVFGFADICREQDVTVIHAIPPTLRQLAEVQNRLPSDSFSKLRLLSSGSAPLHQSTLQSLQGLLPGKIVDNLGQTESVGMTLVSDFLPEGASIFVHGGNSRGTVVQVVDDTGNIMPDGSHGRLRICSDRMMAGYLNDPERTAEALKGGWLLTGDIAYRDKTNKIRLAGRAVDMIKSIWGDIVYPAEIEAVLATDDRIREAVACGFRDDAGNERIAAFIIINSDESEPEAFCESLKDRVRSALGDSKVPNIVMIVDDMPRASHGKVKKRELVEKYLN